MLSLLSVSHKPLIAEPPFALLKGRLHTPRLQKGDKTPLRVLCVRSLPLTLNGVKGKGASASGRFIKP